MATDYGPLQLKPDIILGFMFCEALIYLLDNIYIRFGTKLYRQIVGIPMGTNCAPLVADLFLFCYERDFMTSFSDVKQADLKHLNLHLDIWTTF